MSKTLILCDCSKTQTLDTSAFTSDGSTKCSRIHTALCTSELGDAAALMKKGPSIIACLQERQVFEELAEELDIETPEFMDLRDRAGWSDEGAKSGPKMAALLADSQIAPPAVKMLDIQSEGQCLILGSQEIALSAAAQLAEVLNVTVLLETAEDIPAQPGYDVVLGKFKSAQGALGEFTVKIDALRMVIPGGRGAVEFGPARDGGQTQCDVLLDLRGDAAIFNHKRDGYLRADPRQPAAVATAVFDAGQMVGSFEKPFYVGIDTTVCAHSRASIVGCSNCIDACETGAISPDGESVSIDPMVCAGCGGCASTCPSGAITFEFPPFEHLLQRVEKMGSAYRKAGGKSPRLLVHDAEFGGEMILLSARFGRGLPADVIPFEVESLNNFGHAEMLAALGCGFVAVDLLLTPKSERAALETTLELALAISGDAALRLLDVADPDGLANALYNQETAKPVDPILPIGNRRQVTKMAAKAIHGTLDTPIDLPTGAPFGAVVVDNTACTLCLACVSLCPSGALLDNPDTPQLRFQEDACLQCGICQNACPEKAITLKPQLNLSDAAMSQTIIHEEEPFACISCGSLFGVKSTIDHIVKTLAGKHSMFATNEAGKLIQMCDKCRVETQFHSDTNPFQSADKPKTRTTDDYLKRRDH